MRTVLWMAFVLYVVLDNIEYILKSKNYMYIAIRAFCSFKINCVRTHLIEQVSKAIQCTHLLYFILKDSEGSHVFVYHCLWWSVRW